MRCVILQPSYIPWRGYFDLIRRAEVFVFHDDVQYDKSWRNRNRIKTPRGSEWLSIPVHAHGASVESIPLNAIQTADPKWPRKHLNRLFASYASAPHFDLEWLERLYANPSPLLTEFTIASTLEIAARLGITGTKFLRTSDLGVSGRKTDRVLDILRRVGATQYLSGPAAKDYIEEEKFVDAGIALEWMTYDYPEYPQLYPPFDPYVSVLDLLFMTGEEAGGYLSSRA